MATEVTVPMVGKIISIQVKVGDQVSENDQIATLEAMKMEMPVVAPVGGGLRRLRSRPVRRSMQRPLLPSSSREIDKHLLIPNMRDVSMSPVRWVSDFLPQWMYL